MEPATVELVAIARTNATAGKIVRDFNIQWNPPKSETPATVVAPPVASTNPPPPGR